MLFDAWFVLGFYGAVVVIPAAALGLLLCAASPRLNQRHPRVRRGLWSALVGFSALALSLGTFVTLTVD